jgi:hypothetical protein
MKNKEVFKKILVIASIAGMGIFLNSCASGYVATQPTYSEYTRPPQPSALHIWIDGDWSYSRQTHAYVQQNGYWTKPNPNRIYVLGQWQTTPKGKYWTKGRWQKKEREENRHNRY